MAVLVMLAVLAAVIGLKLWAIYWLYGFIASWTTTGIVPSFWSFVWAVFLVAFVITDVSISRKND